MWLSVSGRIPVGGIAGAPLSVGLRLISVARSRLFLQNSPAVEDASCVGGCKGEAAASVKLADSVPRNLRAMPPTRRGVITCALDSAAVLEAMIAVAITDGRTKKDFAEAGGLGAADLYKYTNGGGSKMSTATLLRVAEGNGFDLEVRIKQKRR